MLKIGNKVLKINDRWLNGSKNLNPLNLPPYTIRLKFNEGVTPSFSKGTGAQVSSSPNIWDLTYVNNDWRSILKDHNNLIEVLGANTINITNMQNIFSSCINLTTVSIFNTSNVTALNGMFYWCYNLISTPLFDTSKVTNMAYMFCNCEKITTIPLYDTSKVTNMSFAFYSCRNVQSGALALYQQASTQTNPPTNHGGTFYQCGINTQTGAAELAQIPSDWK